LRNDGFATQSHQTVGAHCEMNTRIVEMPQQVEQRIAPCLAAAIN
jgi:hypothetical protein